MHNSFQINDLFLAIRSRLDRLSIAFSLPFPKICFPHRGIHKFLGFVNILLENKTFEEREACFSALKSCSANSKVVEFIKNFYTLEVYSSFHNSAHIHLILSVLTNLNDIAALETIEKLYLDPAYALLDEQEKLSIVDVLDDKYFFKSKIKLIEELYTSPSYCHCSKDVKLKILLSVKKYSTQELIENIYANPLFSEIEPEKKELLLSLLNVHPACTDDVFLFIEELCTNSAYHFLNEKLEVKLIFSAILNMLSRRSFSQRSELTDIFEFVKNIYFDPDYAFLHKELHVYCDAAHSRCGNGISLERIAEEFKAALEDGISLARIEDNYSKNFFNLQTTVSYLDNKLADYDVESNNFKEIASDLLPLFIKRDASIDLVNAYAYDDNFDLIRCFENLTPNARRKAVSYLSEIFSPSILKNLPNGFATVWREKFQKLPVSLHKILPFLTSFMEKSESEVVQDASAVRLIINDRGSMYGEQKVYWVREDAFSTLVYQFAKIYQHWLNVELSKEKAEIIQLSAINWASSLKNKKKLESTQEELMQAKKIVHKKMAALSKFLDCLKYFRKIPELQKNGKTEVIEKGFPSHLFIREMLKNKILEMSLKQLQALSNDNNEILNEIRKEWFTFYTPIPALKSARK